MLDSSKKPLKTYVETLELFNKGATSEVVYNKLMSVNRFKLTLKDGISTISENYVNCSLPPAQSALKSSSAKFVARSLTQSAVNGNPEQTPIKVNGFGLLGKRMYSERTKEGTPDIATFFTPKQSRINCGIV